MKAMEPIEIVSIIMFAALVIFAFVAGVKTRKRKKDEEP